MIRFLKNIVFLFLNLIFVSSFAQKKVVEPVLKIYGKDGIIRYYKGGILVKIDSNLSNNSISLKSNKYLSNNAPVFQFGLGKSDQVAMDWGNYHFDKNLTRKQLTDLVVRI